ncbi:gamma-glutamyl-gamma-aminobutyrate hydrolase family protein [Actinosynnema sp. NPDC047251]|uniref:Putative glutamine amidotransferase n=1 Tax=Saccharothrix espanaensis (strain ATCC 51144 / DSM 44229 / JCM 9112 / NBRC 15066 / NRRL 15764) TaxID=1179773 RepID=K0K0A4_SACES|nr:gamma-glutamyl-gamma-aminobutyrate hydrolase family protein [Saccharothrix espanaensis]CCH30329.1 putative glutamine amidotransferase [Saccharothrix espanaensis DSM 44229]
MVSNGSRPLIGVSTYLERARFGVWDVEAAVLHRDYLDSVVRAGGNPVLLPPVGAWDTDSIGFLDGLVLSGGADVDPARYGRARDPRTGPPRTDRDTAELTLVRAALELDLPLLGVCRGMQVLNVALGGTLHQHVEGHNPAPAVFEHTGIAVAPGTRLARIVGPATTVHCHHHQSLDVVGDGLAVVASAPDGTVEAVELPGARFVLGVQSHPEADSEDDRLFAALVDATRKGYAR